MKKAFYAAMMAAALCACGTSGQGGQAVQDDVPDYAAAQKVNTASLQLFYKVYSAEKGKDNICVSPASASWALSMAASGAGSGTAVQLYKALGFDVADAETVNRYQQSTIARLNKHGDDRTTIGIANSMWINKDFKVKKPFIEDNGQYYNAAVKNCVFNADAVAAINRWCSDNTAGRIPEIVKEINPMSQMYLINALYFNSRWKDVFSKERTKEQTFTKENGTKVKVQMMHGTFRARYFENDKVQMTEKAFGKGAFSMYFILPREGVAMDEAAYGLSTGFYAWCDSFSRCDVRLALPRFSADCSTSLKAPLQAMGVNDAFTSAADFSGISKDRMRIGDVLQKTFIKVDEEGAEAAAVTSVILEAASAGPPVIKQMTLDRPFFYAICERATGSILFIGKSGHPEE